MYLWLPLRGILDEKETHDVSLATFAFFASAGFKLNAVSAEDVIKKDENELTLSTEIDRELEEKYELAPEFPEDKKTRLSQEEYDDLINGLPEGAVLVGDIKVMPGVVKDPTKEKPYPD